MSYDTAICPVGIQIVRRKEKMLPFDTGPLKGNTRLSSSLDNRQKKARNILTKTISKCLVVAKRELKILSSMMKKPKD